MNRFLIPDNFVERGDLMLESAALYNVPITEMRVWDAAATDLPGTSANDDLGVYTGTFATAGNYIATSDLKSAGATTRYARFEFALPPEYQNGQGVSVLLTCKTSAVADTSSTVDVACHEVAAGGTVGSDICATTAQSINSATAAVKTFTITPTSLVAGDKLDIRIAVAVTDAAGGSAVVASILHVDMALDIRG